MNKKMRKTVVLLMSSVTLGGYLLPTVTTFAAEAPQQEVTIEQEQSEVSLAELYGNSDFYSVEFDGETTTVSITDKQLVDYLDSQGAAVPNELRMASMSRAQGVTKVVWHGAAKNGNVDVYLSKNTMVTLRASYVGAQLVNQIIQMYLGNYWGAAKAMASTIANTVKLASVKDGKVFKVRKWTSLTTANQ